jgi:hypothetical protein
VLINLSTQILALGARQSSAALTSKSGRGLPRSQLSSNLMPLQMSSLDLKIRPQGFVSSLGAAGAARSHDFLDLRFRGNLRFGCIGRVTLDVQFAFPFGDGDTSGTIT